MSLLHPLGRHRLSASDLRQENRILLAREIAAADYFTLLMQDRDAVYACWQKAAADRDTAESLADQYAQQLAAQDAELRELRAFRDNTLAVSQPAGHRDIDPDEQPTQPIKVITLQQAFGPVVATPGSPDPANVPQQRTA